MSSPGSTTTLWPAQEVALRALPWLLIAACTKVPPAALPSQAGPATYRVGVAVASGNRSVTSVYTLQVAPVGDDTWSFATIHTEGSVETAHSALTYNSARPTSADPWPLTLQHAISTVPAAVRLDDSGRPAELLKADAWRSAGRIAAEKTELPTQAKQSATSLLDTHGYLRDLCRNFPGTPPVDSTWTREEDVAGLPVRRIETCTQIEEGRVTTWTCEGHIEGPTEGGSRLVDAKSTTTLRVDKHGMIDLHTTYEGTLVRMSLDGERVLDSPVAGQRKVVRVE
ncbi:MAG: hypothetical protein ACI9MC_000889 [Kiritimatiellia bacterium]|jgi:hypothetical protein